MSRKEQIARKEARMKAISERLGRSFGPDNASLHDEYQRVQHELGRLLLARDREERPEIYRRRATDGQ